jgi:hypothetical protein
MEAASAFLLLFLSRFFDLLYGLSDIAGEIQGTQGDHNTVRSGQLSGKGDAVFDRIPGCCGLPVTVIQDRKSVV